MSNYTAMAAEISFVLIGGKEVDGQMVPMVHEPVGGMDEAVRKMVLMYAAGADRVTLMVDFTLSDGDKAELRSKAEAAAREQRPEGQPEAEPRGENVIDLAKVKAAGRA